MALIHVCGLPLKMGDAALNPLVCQLRKTLATTKHVEEPESHVLVTFDRCPVPQSKYPLIVTVTMRMSLMLTQQHLRNDLVARIGEVLREFVFTNRVLGCECVEVFLRMQHDSDGYYKKTKTCN